MSDKKLLQYTLRQIRMRISMTRGTKECSVLSKILEELLSAYDLQPKILHRDVTLTTICKDAQPGLIAGL